MGVLRQWLDQLPAAQNLQEFGPRRAGGQLPIDVDEEIFVTKAAGLKRTQSLGK